MDAIEPLRPSRPAIAPIDGTRVKLPPGERDNSSDQGPPRERDGGQPRERNGGQPRERDGGQPRERDSEQPRKRERLPEPSVLIDPELLGEQTVSVEPVEEDPPDGIPRIDLIV